jgi:hypothetical protein
MLTHTTDPPRPEERFVADGSERDTVVVLSAVPFAVYEALLKARRDAPAPRYAYRNGDLGACRRNRCRCEGARVEATAERAWSDRPSATRR